MQRDSATGAKELSWAADGRVKGGGGREGYLVMLNNALTVDIVMLLLLLLFLLFDTFKSSLKT